MMMMFQFARFALDVDPSIGASSALAVRCSCHEVSSNLTEIFPYLPRVSSEHVVPIGRTMGETRENVRSDSSRLTAARARHGQERLSRFRQPRNL